VTTFKAQTENYDQRVRASLARQNALTLMGAKLLRVEPGLVDLEIAHDDRLTQQHGFIHAGITTTLLDSACGYAAFSLMPADAGVLTVELKTSLLAPADGERFVFEGRVLKAGRTISFCEGRAYAHKQGQERLIATMSTTMMTVTGRSAVQG
jgi:uncharacterized protein (TIGR00369 family)